MNDWLRDAAYPFEPGILLALILAVLVAWVWAKTERWLK